MAEESNYASFDIDHFVSKCDTPAKLEESIKFYGDILRMKPERLEEYRAGEVGFPSYRFSPMSVVDLFPTWSFGMEPATSTRVDHVCLATSGETMIQTLGRMLEHRIMISRKLENAWGSRGNAYSVYFEDPNAVLLEMRTYDESFWSKAKEIVAQIDALKDISK